MLTALTTGLRFKLAAALAIFAALSFVAPPAVLAFGHGANTLHCLANAGKTNHGGAASHAEHHGTASDDADHHAGHSSPDTDHEMACCSLFCLSALAPDLGILNLVELPEIPSQAETIHFVGRVSERLDRPPILVL